MTAALHAVEQADTLARQALAGTQLAIEDLDALYALYEELTGHLMLLIAGAEDKYRHMPPGARMRNLVSDAVRLGSGLLARPLRIGVLDIVIMAPICRLLLALHQGRDAFTQYANGSPLVWAEQPADDIREAISASAGEQ